LKSEQGPIEMFLIHQPEGDVSSHASVAPGLGVAGAGEGELGLLAGHEHVGLGRDPLPGDENMDANHEVDFFLSGGGISDLYNNNEDEVATTF
jgi:hypothetical protein